MVENSFLDSPSPTYLPKSGTVTPKDGELKGFCRHGRDACLCPTKAGLRQLEPPPNPPAKKRDRHSQGGGATKGVHNSISKL